MSNSAKALTIDNFDNNELGNDNDGLETVARHFKITPVDVQDDTDVLTDDDTELVDDTILTDDDIPDNENEEYLDDVSLLNKDDSVDDEEIPDFESDEPEPETAKVYSTNVPAKNYNRKTIAIDVQEGLSDIQLAELAERIVKLGMEMKGKKDSWEAAKAEASDYRKQMDSKSTEMIELVSEYQYGKVTRTHTCYRRENYDELCYEYIDIHSERVIKTEPFERGILFDFLNKRASGEVEENPFEAENEVVNESEIETETSDVNETETVNDDETENDFDNDSDEEDIEDDVEVEETE